MQLNIHFGKRTAGPSMVHKGGAIATGSIPDFTKELLRKYAGFQSYLTTAFGCVQPPYDPALQLAFTKKNAYHSGALHLKKSMTVGKGYDGDPELLAWLKTIKTPLGLQSFFNQCALDLETHAYTFVEVAQGVGQTGLYRQAPARTRVMAPTEKRSLGYLHFSAELDASGKLKRWGWAEFEPFVPGMQSGIKMLRLPAPDGDDFYSWPEHVSCYDVIKMNVSIIDYANSIFEKGMMNDFLFVLQGADLDDEVREGIQSMITEKWRGMNSAHKVGWLEIGDDEKFTVERLNQVLLDPSFSSMRKDNREEIATAHMVPPRLLGIIAASSLGGSGEVEGQLKVVKLATIDGRQALLEAMFQELFTELGAPQADTFRFKPLDITAGSLDATTLSTLVGSGILTQAEAVDEWNTEKSADAQAQRMIYNLRKLREALRSPLEGGARG